MLDVHITEFYRDVAHIMLALFRAFPRRVSLYVEDISGPDTPDDYGLHSERHLACFSTFLWLEEEGLLRYQDVDSQTAFNHCVLTLDALRWLSSFDTQSSQPKLADRLKLALAEGTSDDIEILVQALLHAQASKQSLQSGQTV